ncbi:uncharacterized protein HMPREF1541_06556 [Cyphellophora europaea CBS 101466]|uniref:RING-type domain-containing protein n=1 Tax=Cyphellophora europaea (strain CBS 101466) TaxID=1220924 RepID=W2RPS7_CYPE1|nr:uncharacterized protein HMPREF1541_06556 [Cyphellophora europaea CBS 101466]ETN38521.1 hypothetical protein HMPREF1541_06556 [Cyphellophora europaea CBS 101466]
MAYQPPTSPPTQHFDAFSPVSPHASMSSDGRRSTHTTPKRRRLAPTEQFNFDNATPFAVPDDGFDAWSPIEEYREYRHRQPHQPPPLPELYWDMLESPWADFPEHLPPFVPAQPPLDQQPRGTTDRIAFPPRPSIAQLSQSIQPYYHRAYYHRSAPSRPNAEPHFSMAGTSNLTALQLPVIPSSQPLRKGAIILTLSRATQESIEQLAEHKRECPACQLDFEPDNFLAVIGCCDTAMHAVCFSAWINSNNGPGGSRTKTCMKCRKNIEALDKMNTMLPPVDGKSWDEGQDFNAPQHLGADTPYKIDISPLPHPVARRHRRREIHAHRARPLMVPESDIPEESREEFRGLQRQQMRERDQLSARVKSTQSSWSMAFDIEARAAATATNAKEALDAGGRITQREVEGLVRRHREAKDVQEESHEIWREAEEELKQLDSRHRQAQIELLQRARAQRQQVQASMESGERSTLTSAAATEGQDVQ